jgi:hypothetical protein
MTIVFRLPEDVLKATLFPFLTLSELSALDRATLSRAYRTVYLNSLQNMHYSATQAMTKDCLMWMISRRLSIRRLIISNHVDLSTTCTKIAMLKTLTEVEFPCCGHLMNADVKLITEHCQSITQLGITGCEKITDEAVKYFGNLPYLTRVDISVNPQLSNASLAAISAGCPNLEELDIHNCPKITDTGVNMILTSCHKLVSFLTSGCPRVNPVPIVLRFNQGLYGSDPATQLSITRAFRRILSVGTSPYVSISLYAALTPSPLSLFLFFPSLYRAKPSYSASS